jgi:hypothetical protein
MIIVRRRNVFSKIVIDNNRFMLFINAINFLKKFSDGQNNILIEIKIVDTLSEHTDSKICFHNYKDAVNFLKEKNGEG